jgi:hypothetical protein
VEGGDAAQPESQTYQVPTVALDDYIARTGARPDLIKIDAESAELDILRGLERTLGEAKPAVTIEVGDHDLRGVSDSATVVRHLIDRGYVAREWRDGGLQEHAPRDRYGYGNLLFVAEGKSGW